ncbi:MAG: gamma-glutamyl-gamma-aminobutyrate hydrolase family protein [Gammaproteobacteria bacterium]|nr:gamma-glutamyl-gamma-aminobutyrate hydrolase family protein [Gammaproteobacteria bacterium]
MQGRRPLIGVISDRRVLGQHPYHLVGEKYLDAVLHGAGGLPVALPVLGGDFDIRELLGRLDGLLLTGSPSNVEPRRYQGQPLRPGMLHDPERDAAALALIPAVVAAGMPLLAICRGFQEMNVAFGGTLHQAVQELPGFVRHREEAGRPLAEQYAPSHEVRFTAGGLLERLAGHGSARVNSVHSQGVDRLAPSLAVEALAPDGLVEAFVLRDAPGFTLALQWHPEWQFRDNALSLAIFRAFGDAARRYDGAGVHLLTCWQGQQVNK